MGNQTKLSPEELHSIAKGLSTLEPGILPFDIFHAMTKLIAMPIVELVPIRRNIHGSPEILLLRRDANDPIWPNQLHIPGTVVRATDTEENFQDAFHRISEELGCVLPESPTFVKNIIHHSGRGMEVSQIYWIDMNEQTVTKGTFFPADNLPQELVQSQLDFIPDAVAHYMQQNN